MRRLLVNADDFGMTAGVNGAVLHAAQCGIVTSTTLMAGGNAFEDAVGRAATQPQLAVGVHVVLVEGTPILNAASIPSLATEDPQGGSAFRRGFGRFICAALCNQIPAHEIELEAEAQIRRVQAAGITVSHLDTHTHAHVFPEVFRPLLRVASALNIPAIRNPYEPPGVTPLTGVLPHPRLWARFLPVRAVRIFAAEFRQQVRAEGLVTTDGTVGITLTGSIDQQRLERLLERLPEGTWELLCHPAYENSAWRAMGTRAGAGERELQVLTSAETQRCLERCGIELISYRDLVAEARRAAA